MKKILIYLILLANFCPGLAFAMDTHPEALVAYDSAAVDFLFDGDHQNHPDDDLHHDDHCCHGAAHLSGMIFKQSTLPLVSSRSDFLALSETPKILYIAPLLRPPII